ncbi:MAG: bifunctional DNA-binding transcriptional regulator/O6-methylguanine-DNA methyltransferase Ada [Acidobacteria bacterium]|nr:bifunctional DNA-binding transcriptional regulator/O6-methylguanine-DNA methyltransferase Ada [Acidobacteriota bacterium]
MITHDLAWKAVAERDRRFDGEFVYAVTTTSIYCRPSCASRRPRRENVRFFETPAAAESEAFRPCLRCDPRDESVSLSERARQMLEASLDDPPSLEQLARRLSVSRFHLQRTFKKTFGLSPKQYLAARQIESMRQHLKAGADVLTATYAAGYGSTSRIYERGSEALGMTPGVYRRGGTDLSIRYVIAASSLGRLLVAGTVRGICAVWFGDTDAELEEMIRGEFPNADVQPAAGDEMRQLVLDVIGAIEFDSGTERIPLEVAATTFQMRVWNALRAIPAGSTRSYREIASEIGEPGAARAVGNACASNRVAYLIPCHRAVPSGGGIGRYRWGTSRKQELLRRERAAQPGAMPDEEV